MYGSLLMIIVAASAGKYVVAAIVAVLVGIAVLLFAASSDLIDMKLFKFDPHSQKYPEEAKVEYWYAKAAKRFESFLMGGGWSYAKAKKRARMAVKKGGKKLEDTTREKMPSAARRFNRDIAIGALAIAIVLVVLLVLGVV